MDRMNDNIFRQARFVAQEWASVELDAHNFACKEVPFFPDEDAFASYLDWYRNGLPQQSLPCYASVLREEYQFDPGQTPLEQYLRNYDCYGAATNDLQRIRLMGFYGFWRKWAFTQAVLAALDEIDEYPCSWRQKCFAFRHACCIAYAVCTDEFWFAFSCAHFNGEVLAQIIRARTKFARFDEGGNRLSRAMYHASFDSEHPGDIEAQWYDLIQIELISDLHTRPFGMGFAAFCGRLENRLIKQYGPGNSQATTPNALIEDIAMHPTGDFDAAERRLEQTALLRYLERHMPPKDWKILWFDLQDKRPAKEKAESLGIKPDAYYKRVQRAEKKCRELRERFDGPLKKF